MLGRYLRMVKLQFRVRFRIKITKVLDLKLYRKKVLPLMPRFGNMHLPAAMTRIYTGNKLAMQGRTERGVWVCGECDPLIPPTYIYIYIYIYIFHLLL